MEKYGDFSKYNDYELLYLIRANVEEARDILFWKYSFLIKSRINRLGVPRLYWDEAPTKFLCRRANKTWAEYQRQRRRSNHRLLRMRSD